MTKYFFFGSAPFRQSERHITKGSDYIVHGGLSKADHERTVEITEEVSKECRKDPPQTSGEFRMIVNDAVKKVGAGAT